MTLCSRGPDPGALKKWISPCSPRIALASLKIGVGELIQPESDNARPATTKTRSSKLMAANTLSRQIIHLRLFGMDCPKLDHASVNFERARGDKLLYHTARWGRRRDVMGKTLATTACVLGLFVNVGANTAKSADLVWQVENPFRFFKGTRSFAIHEAAFNAA